MCLNHHGYGWNYFVLMAMMAFGAIQHKTSITLLTGRSLMLLSLAEDEFIQVSQSVQQTSLFTAAGACRVSIGLPFFPRVAGVLAQRPEDLLQLEARLVREEQDLASRCFAAKMSPNSLILLLVFHFL